MDQQYNKRAEKAPWKFKTRLAHCEIWENTMTRMIVQAYPIDNYERTHARINRNKSHLVNTHGAVTCNKTHQTYLLVERIPSRLSQITNLNEAQTLKVLLAALRGLDELEQIYGLVGLTENCICFNQQGKVKIWINSDLSSLHPVILAQDKSFNTMVQILSQIVSMISLKCFNETFLNPFLQKLHNHKIYSFSQAAEQIVRMAELLFIDIQEKPKSYSKYPIDKEMTRDASKIFHQDSHHHASFKIEKISHQLPKNSHKFGHSRHFSGHDKTENMNHKRSLSYANLQKGIKQNEKMQKEKENCEPATCVYYENKFAKSQTHYFTKFGESVPQSPREGIRPLNLHGKYFQKEKQQVSLDKIGKNVTTRGCVEEIDLPNIIQKARPLNIKASICPNIEQQFLAQQTENNLCQNAKSDKLEALSPGQFLTFGILEDSSDKRVSEKTKEDSLDRNWSNLEGENDLNLDMMDLQIQKTLEKKKKEKKDRVSIMEQIEGQGKKSNAKGFVETKEVKQLSIFCSSLNNKQNIRQMENHQTSSSWKKRLNKDKAPSFAFIDQKYEQYFHTKGTQKRNNENKAAYPRVVSKYSVQPGISGDSHFFNAKTPFFLSSFHNSSSENLTAHKRPLHHY